VPERSSSILNFAHNEITGKKSVSQEVKAMESRRHQFQQMDDRKSLHGRIND
jgi:hypothetical protein